jgi:CheY-like chemotaxis protein
MREDISVPEIAGRVLLIEDVQAMRLYLRLSLEHHGYEVTEAANLQEARDLIKAGDRAGTILLDLELPDGYGLDIIRDVPRDVAVIALSADDSRETERQCLSAGCRAVLSKGENLSRILQVIAHGAGEPPQDVTTLGYDPELAAQYNAYLVEARIGLQRANDVHDFDVARRIAHRLRGTAVHFGYRGIGISALAVSDALASGDIDRIESAAQELIDRLLDATASTCVDQAFHTSVNVQ